MTYTVQQLATRGRSRCSGFTFWELSYRPSLYTVYGFTHRLPFVYTLTSWSKNMLQWTVTCIIFTDPGHERADALTIL